MNLTQIGTNIVAYALQIGLLAGIGAALPALLRLKAPGARLRYWQLLLAACFALPWVRPWHSETVVVTGVPFAAAQILVRTATGMPDGFAMPSVTLILCWVLAAGAAARLAWLGVGLLKLARYRRRGHGIPLPPEWTGAAGTARLLLSDEVGGPVTFGFFRPVVLLPAGFPWMPEAMRDAILFHELIHVERRDWLYTIGEEVARAVFWFHPAIWWVLGEIQLAREQTVDRAVIEMTQARDSYVDALLAMAGMNQWMDLTPAPLFLRRRHLKQRVMGIVQEAGMSKKRVVFAQIAALGTLAAACWFVTGAIPLQAQAQMVMDGAGVTVNLNGSPLMHRSPVMYPAAALAKGVEGTVVVQVRLDANGEVIDAAVLSGPDELRKGVQQSVLNWHFDKSAASATRVVNIDFVKPPNPLATAISAFNGAAAPPPPPPPPPSQLGEMQARRAVAPIGTIDRIDVTGLSESATTQLLADFPVHVGDPVSAETMARAAEAARQFDEHLSVTTTMTTAGGRVMRISAPGSAASAPQPTSGLTAPAGAARIGPNVIAANLVHKVTPAYPPLAKMAGVQGTVSFQAVIGKDGSVEQLQLLSGAPLLVPAAMEAVKQWVYKPTLLNGAAVEVVTTIDVNFTLQDSAPTQ